MPGFHPPFVRAFTPAIMSCIFPIRRADIRLRASPMGGPRRPSPTRRCGSVPEAARDRARKRPVILSTAFRRAPAPAYPRLRYAVSPSPKNPVRGPPVRTAAGPSIASMTLETYFDVRCDSYHRVPARPSARTTVAGSRGISDRRTRDPGEPALLDKRPEPFGPCVPKAARVMMTLG